MWAKSLQGVRNPEGKRSTTLSAWTAASRGGTRGESLRGEASPVGNGTAARIMSLAIRSAT